MCQDGCVNPPPETNPARLFGILPKEGEWGWVWDPIQKWALPFQTDTSMGLLARTVWDAAAGHAEDAPDFEFEVTFMDSQSPLDPDGKPNGTVLHVRRCQKAGIPPETIHQGQEQRLYRYDFKGSPRDIDSRHQCKRD